MARVEEAERLVLIAIGPDDKQELIDLLGALSADFPAPLVIIPRRPELVPDGLVTLLGERTDLPVVDSTSGERSLEPGHVYLVPIDRAADITRTAVSVAPSPGNGANFFDQTIEVASSAFGEDLTVVILRGSATNGAEEIYDVKRNGGTVVVQSVGGYATLPAAIPGSQVDIVARLEEIGPILDDLLHGQYAPTEPTEEEALEAVLNDLQERFGIDFSSYKRPTILRRLGRRMADTGQNTMVEYLHYLHGHPEEYQRVVSSFLIKVTEFFRDASLFDYLREHILPALIETARERDYELRLWSAGCATGEETYSLAMLLVDLLGDELDRFHVRIFATDLDGSAIEYARHGVYPRPALGNVSEELLRRHFVEIDGEYQVKKRIRSLCVFGQHDLAERAPFPRIDLLMSRNVLIYFTSDLQRRVLQLFAFSLRDGGYLVLGKSESTAPLPDHFVVDDSRLKIYRRRGERMLMPAGRARGARVQPPQPQTPQSAHPSRNPIELGRKPAGRDRTDDVLLGLPIGVVCVDSRYDIQIINNAARRMLRIHGSAIGDDLIHLAHDLPTDELRSALDAGFEGVTTVIEDVPVTDPATREQRFLRVTVRSDQTRGSGDPLPHAVLLIEDVSDHVLERRRIEDELAEERDRADTVQHQVELLTASNRDLIAANEELSATNMELRGTNEEFVVGNEELQAAAEEVETLNEELQATNEELETLNEELQATVEELNATNDDLQARTLELQELAVSLEVQNDVIETERSRLEAILAGMAEAVLVVDSERKIVLTNSAYARMFPQPPELLDPSGRPLSAEETPTARAARGDTFQMEFAIREPNGSSRRFEATGRPIAGRDGARSGVVVVHELTDRSRTDNTLY